MESFYKKIIGWKKSKPSTNRVTSNGNELICNVREDKKNDYLHVLFYPTKTSIIKKHLKKMRKYINSKIVNDYCDFLAVHNGMLLYAGAIVIFGATLDNSINEFIEPPSLLRMNENDNYSRANHVIYIGNLMHSDYSSVNIYIDLDSNKILWLHRENVIIEFNSLNEFLVFIIKFYDPKYNHDGLNENFDDRNKNVYENTQLFI